MSYDTLVARTWSVVLTGLTGSLVEVEADLSTKVPGFSIIGLADKAIGEAQQRVVRAQREERRHRADAGRGESDEAVLVPAE